MKRNSFVQMACAVLTVVMMLGIFSVSASAHGHESAFCKECVAAGITCKKLTATTEFVKVSETQCARLYECNHGHKVLRYHRDGSFRDAERHVAVTAATCEKAAVCGNCKCTFGAPLEHTFDQGVVRRPTCFQEGATVYTCKVCGLKLETDKVKPLYHWYDVWEPAGAGLNSAPCKRPGCTHVKTTACAEWEFCLMPAGAEKPEAYTVCPVCGALSDGECLELVDAVPTPVTAWTPEGDLVFRHGTMANGEELITVGFEYDARLQQYYGVCKFTVPAELLEDRQVMILDAQGNETELEVETDGNTCTVTLNFDNSTTGQWSKVRVLHLIPVAPVEK